MNTQRRKANDTLARHIQQHGVQSQQPALPPMPTQDGVCRWCEGTFNIAGLCQRGCAANEDAPFTGQCAECNRSFKTGRPSATICHECDDKERKAYTSAAPLGTFKRYTTLREDR